MHSNLWRPRAVIIHRDDNGFGLTVSGDNPVSVQTIKKGGAAECAGIREGDIIIKVNGTTVEHMNHPEVVHLIISAGPYVTLTVRPNDMIGINNIRPQQQQQQQQYVLHERITAPLPVDPDVQMQMEGNKLRTLQVYRDQAAAEVEKSWKKYNETQSIKDKIEFEKTEKSLRMIEAQMKIFRTTTSGGGGSGSNNLQLHSPLPFNPYPSSHQPIIFQPHQQQQQHGGQQQFGIKSTHSFRNPIFYSSHHQQQLLHPHHHPHHHNNSKNSWDFLLDDDIPPPLPPRSFSQQSDLPILPGYSIYDPQLQHQQQHYGGSSNDFLFDVNKPSTSQQQQHHRAKSSPDPISMQKVLNSIAEASSSSKRSDSVSDLSTNINSSTRSTSDSLDLQGDGGGGGGLNNNILISGGSPPPPYNTGKYNNNIIGGGSGSSTSEESNPKKSNDQINNENLIKSMHKRLPFPSGDIISMEEDDVIDPSSSSNIFMMSSGSGGGGGGKQGPYSNLTKLLEHNSHLAVFMNYIIDTRSDTSSLLFYLITGLYIEEGTMKEMKRWGYEIHSTFTAPNSPLHVPNVDENIAAEIDDALLRESDREEMMRRVFRKARNKAKEEINKQLEEFCKIKTSGLGSMFGPPDSQLEESYHDKSKETKIVELYLLPRLEFFLEEWEKTNDDRTLAIINGISTILQRQFGIRAATSSSSSGSGSSSGNSNIIEKCSSFVSREKSMRSKFMSKHKKINYNGHHFTPNYYCSYTECNICCKLLWGVGPQGLQCSDCNVNIHRSCLNHIQDNCLGSEIGDISGGIGGGSGSGSGSGTSGIIGKKKDRLKQFKDKITSSTKSSSDLIKRRSSSNPLKRSDDFNHSTTSTSIDFESSNQGSNMMIKNDIKRQDRLNEEGMVESNECTTTTTTGGGNTNEPRRLSNAVGRSESCKERVQRKHTRERRKHSDPNLTSKTSDVDIENQQLSDTNNSKSSSNSSLSGRSGGGGGGGGGGDNSPSSSLEHVHHPHSHHHHHHSNTSRGDGPDPNEWDDDSDIEIEQDPSDWMKNINEKELIEMSILEKKRQEVLNELLHTERSHVRNLKILDRLFHRPLKQNGYLPIELLSMLFGHLEDMLDIHNTFNILLKKKKKETILIGDISHLLLQIFSGEQGERFKKTASLYCSRQQIGLKLLKEKREKSIKLNTFLNEIEILPICRRLQIQDMIPMAMQRLTKYPLIFENLFNCSLDNSSSSSSGDGGAPGAAAPAPSSGGGGDEKSNLYKIFEKSKEILNSINLCKKEAEDEERLKDIQRKLDKSSLDKGGWMDKMDINIINELRNLDLTKHKLIFEGTLMWRVKSTKSTKSDALQEVLCLLLHDMVVILLKSSPSDPDKYILKIHTSLYQGGSGGSGNKSSERIISRPIIKLNNMIHRANASNKTAFMLINITSTNMYELVCSTTEERKQWLFHITKAAEDYKNRQQESRLQPDLDDKKLEEDEEEDQQQGQQRSSSSIVGGTLRPDLNEDNKDEIKNVINMEDLTAQNNNNSSTGPGGVGGPMSTNEIPPTPPHHQQPPPQPSPIIIRNNINVIITESLPLIEPSEVTIETKNIQYAQPIISQYEELKLMDVKINQTLDDKLKLASHLLHITTSPTTTTTTTGGSGSGVGGECGGDVIMRHKDIKELVVSCIENVDQLGRILSIQKITHDNIPIYQEQVNIQQNLNHLLTQLLSEVHRKDEELEMRRQELHRLREQNHGYQQRLQSSTNEETKQQPRPLPPLSHSSPIQSRPNSFLSISSSADEQDDIKIVGRQDEEQDESDVPLKMKLLTHLKNSNPTNETSCGDDVVPAGASCDVEPSCDVEACCESSIENENEWFFW